MMKEGTPSIELQTRDLDILLGLFECRVMTLRHVSELYFGGKGEAAKKRIQRLKACRYIRERSRRIGEPSVLHLTRKGFDTLSEEGRLDAFPALSPSLFEKRSEVSELTLRHELQVMDVRTKFYSAISKRSDLSITEFSTWPRLFQFNACYIDPVAGRREVMVKPDGFIRIKQEENGEVFEHMFFLEVDRSTESQEILAQKAACYLDFYQSGGMAVRFGASRHTFRDYPFRVLLICRNELRRNNALERLRRNTPPILSLVWASTLVEIADSPFGNIWLRSKDYSLFSKGSHLDRASSEMPRTEKDLGGELSAQKLRLFPGANKLLSL